MKTLLSLTTVITLAAGGFLLNAQADESVSTSNTAAMSVMPVELQQLEAKLTGMQYDLSDRNTKLRVQRAAYYFAIARKHADSGWSKMAAEQATRGLSLLQLSNMQYLQSTNVQM